VNSFHNFGIVPDVLAPGLKVVATALDGTVEAVRHESLPQWGVMWHPERPPSDPADVELMRALLGGQLR
jgi:putative glutamine amidotransferase